MAGRVNKVKMLLSHRRQSDYREISNTTALWPNYFDLQNIRTMHQIQYRSRYKWQDHNTALSEYLLLLWFLQIHCTFSIFFLSLFRELPSHILPTFYGSSEKDIAIFDLFNKTLNYLCNLQSKNDIFTLQKLFVNNLDQLFTKSLSSYSRNCTPTLHQFCILW